MTHLREWARKQPDKAAYHFVETGETVTYRQLDERSERIARWLIDQGLEPGDGVALLLGNHPRLFELAWGIRRAGLYYTPLSTHLHAKEAAYVLNDCGASLLIASREYADLASAILATGGARLPPRRFMLDGTVDRFSPLETELAEASPASLPPRPVGRDFLYSSGTTGTPKGVRKPLVAWDNRHLEDPEVTAWRKSYGFDADAVYLSLAPLYHAAPLRFCMRTLEIGGSCIIFRRFDAENTLAAIERFHITHSQLVPTMFIRLLALPSEVRSRYRLSSLRMVVHTAAPCPIDVKERMIDWWGPVVWEFYGGSEGIGLTVISPEEWLTHKGSVGKAVYGTVHILDAFGNELPLGEIGSVYFSGGARFEYHNAPEKTLASYDAQGRATYGDLGKVDAEGYLYLSDRRADLIISGGVNIYPKEIEDVLITHPDVIEAIVIGVPNPEFGEEVKALVHLRESAPDNVAKAEELLSLCRDNLSSIKLPRSIEFVASVPRSATGKLNRRELKERYRNTTSPT